eukprot:PITA_19373
MEYFRWKELPQDIQEKVLARLPLPCIGRFRSVCKKWNNLLSSTRFVTTLWAQTPAHRNPWLVALCWLNVVEFCPSYNFTTKTWEKPFSFSFLREKAAAIAGGFRVGLCHMSSAAGLCIVDLMPLGLRSETLPIEENFLCNPITRTFLKLPNIPSRKSIVIMEGEGNTYKIVAFSESGDGGHIVSIYDPSQKIWTMVGQLPSNLKLAEGRMVASKSSVYSLVFFRLSRTAATCGYVHIDGQVEVHDEHEFQDESAEQLQDEFTEERQDECAEDFQDEFADDLQDKSAFENEVEYEFEDEAKFDNEFADELQEQFLIWELQENMASSSNSSPSSCWKEIAKMPSSVCKKLSNNMITNWLVYLECVGAGDYVVFSIVSRNEIFYYDLSQQLWGSFHFQSESDRASLFAFEPRPDVKVE